MNSSSCLSPGDVLLLSEADCFPAESRAVFSGMVASYKKEMSLQNILYHLRPDQTVTTFRTTFSQPLS